MLVRHHLFHNNVCLMALASSLFFPPPCRGNRLYELSTEAEAESARSGCRLVFRDCFW